MNTQNEKYKQELQFCVKCKGKGPVVKMKATLAAD